VTGPSSPWQPPVPGTAASPAPRGYYAPPPGYYAPPPGWPAAPWGDGPPGQLRATGRSILLFVVTVGIYGYVYTYKVHEEMKQHSGRGLGGGIALLLLFLAGIAMPFLTSSEVGGLYARKGRPEPVRAWTGLWVLIPAIAGYAVLLMVIFAVAAAQPGAGFLAVFLAGMGTYLLCVAAGMAVWFVRTNEALNRYWLSVGAAPLPR
jgi:hypothetical protein